jgi:hypothetical protein
MGLPPSHAIAPVLHFAASQAWHWPLAVRSWIAHRSAADDLAAANVVRSPNEVDIASQVLCYRGRSPGRPPICRPDPVHESKPVPNVPGKDQRA